MHFFREKCGKFLTCLVVFFVKQILMLVLNTNHFSLHLILAPSFLLGHISIRNCMFVRVISLNRSRGHKIKILSDYVLCFQINTCTLANNINSYIRQFAAPIFLPLILLPIKSVNFFRFELQFVFCYFLCFPLSFPSHIWSFYLFQSIKN